MEPEFETEGGAVANGASGPSRRGARPTVAADRACMGRSRSRSTRTSRRTPSPIGDARRAAVGGEYWLAEGALGRSSGRPLEHAEESNAALSGGFTVQVAALDARRGSGDQSDRRRTSGLERWR